MNKPEDMNEILAAKPYPPSMVGWTTVFLLQLFFILALVDRQILALLARSIQHDLGISDVELGFLQGFGFSLFFGSTGLLIGWLLDRFARRLIIFFGVFFWSLSCAAGGFASNYASMFLSRLGVGVGEATLVPGTYSMVRDLFPPNRIASAIGVFTTGGGLGICLSYALGGNLAVWLADKHGIFAPLAAHFHPWQSEFLICGLPGMFLAFGIFLIREPQRRESIKATSAFLPPIVALFRRHPRLLTCHLLGFSFAYTCVVAVLSWTPIFMGRRFGWDTAAIGNSLAFAFGIMPPIGSLIAGFTADRLFSAGIKDIFFRAMIVSLGLGMAASIVGYLSPSPWMFLGLISIMGTTVGSASALAATSLQTIAPSGLTARMTTIYLFIQTLLGYGGGPLVVGTITDHVLHDRAMVGISIAATVAMGGTVSIIFLVGAMKPFRALVAQKGLAA